MTNLTEIKKSTLINFKNQTKEQVQNIAINLAEQALPIWERYYLGDVRPREAIKAAKQYLAGYISLKELRSKRSLAYASYVDTDTSLAALTRAVASPANAVAYAAYAVCEVADAYEAFAYNYAAAWAAEAVAYATYALEANERTKQKLNDYLCKGTITLNQ